MLTHYQSNTYHPPNPHPRFHPFTRNRIPMLKPTLSLFKFISRSVPGRNPTLNPLESPMASFPVTFNTLTSIPRSSQNSHNPDTHCYIDQIHLISEWTLFRIYRHLPLHPLCPPALALIHLNYFESPPTHQTSLCYPTCHVILLLPLPIIL